MFPLRLSGAKYVSRYLPMNLPRRSPMSRHLYSAKRSIRPLLLGVPVMPTTRLSLGLTFMNALKRLDCQFLKLESSSNTHIS